MKVGDYVRTEDDLGVQLICKIKARFNDFCNTDEGYWDDNHIIKSSPNIIDLIEVGDYVNGSRVEEIEEYNGEKYLYLEEMEYSNANQDYINVYCKQEYIKSIVTKEAFESMEYRIGE